MPLELQIIRASEFIRLSARGRLDLATSREMLRQLAGACWRRGINQALLDLRDLHPGSTPMLTSSDLAELVNAFCTMGFSGKLRLALLYSADPHRRARLFAFLTTLHGWNVAALESFEEALIWLSQRTEEEDQKEAGGQEIRIHVKGTADALPEQTQPPEESRKEKETPPPSDHRRPPSAASTKVPMKRRPKPGRSRT